MAVFNQQPIDENTDINVPFINNLIGGINEALVLQNTGGKFIATGAVTIQASEFTQTTTQGFPYSYYTANTTIYFNSLLPDNVEFTETPAVIAVPQTQVPLFASAGITNAGVTATTKQCRLFVNRAAAGITTVTIIAIGQVNQNAT